VTLCSWEAPSSWEGREMGPSKYSTRTMGNADAENRNETGMDSAHRWSLWVGGGWVKMAE
jgi:hypothetical protein